MKYHSFLNDAITQFIDEVERLLRDEFPPEGLVIDVRGNGGGYVFAADSLLQMLTPNMVTPEPAQFINTASTLSFTDQVLAWNKWHDSLLQGIQTGANYSHAFPLYLQEDINTRGQISHGPVVLITDAFCYSATDIFSAGFKDHAIGTIIGVDNATGAGGAVVLEQKELLKEWLGGPLKDLPNGATMRVSLVRTLRVGDRAGQPVEDLGVEPDTLVEMTQDDLLFGNRDLHEKSGAILAGGVPRAFRVEEKSVVGVEVTIKIMTLNIPQVDIYVNDRPIGMNETPDGTTTLTVEIPGVGSIIRLIGFENGKIVGAGQLVIN